MAELTGFGTKASVAAKLSKIVKSTRLHCRVQGDNKTFILNACRKVERFATVANDPSVWITVEQVRCGIRYVRMLVLHRREPSAKRASRQPCPKAQLLDGLFPSKKRKAQTPKQLAKQKAITVRSAMRVRVEDQIKDFRRSLEFPRFCERTRVELKEWSKVDIDHLGCPFVQLCDEFMKTQNLYYSDIVLKGPPNCKEVQNQGFNKRWEEYHRSEACLGAVDASANRSAGCGHYEPNEALWVRPDETGDLDMYGW